MSNAIGDGSSGAPPPLQKAVTCRKESRPHHLPVLGVPLSRTIMELRLEGPFLWRDSGCVFLSPVQASIIAVFLRHPNKPLLGRTLKALSGAMKGEDDALIRVHIKLLREALGEPRGNPRLIRTIPGYGYMLVTDERLGKILDKRYDGLGRRHKK